MSAIVTHLEYPPIPDRSYDWRAVFEWYSGDDNQPVGWGETKGDAILDLLQNAWDFEDDGSIRDEIINLAFAEATRWTPMPKGFTAQTEGE